MGVAIFYALNFGCNNVQKWRSYVKLGKNWEKIGKNNPTKPH